MPNKTTRTPADVAERIQRRRAGVMMLEAVLFLGWQANFLISPHRDIGQAWRVVEMIRLPALLVWAVVLLVLVGAGGAWFRGKEVRDLVEDESTIAHRRRALAWGYWAAMAATILVYLLALVHPLRLVEALHLILSLGLAVPLIGFAILERRAARHG